ncbi:LytTR family DNA-binding domain-containing protein [Cellulomonas sp. RIT-PI-Y]|uniref:LytR/AlgR family response regulator transcription factor n=1 Tax=Cellulomonas sp. RIT-PI-Y TaxID=3035297 RepID=UPI0021DAD155|nr:LytTR family DNA-binding domain-containing protein [Cellulomonas sp. RIT-PI-Y]
MFTITMAEDDPADAAQLAGQIRRYARERGIEIALTRHADGAALIEAHDGATDLLLLDVVLPDLDGFSVAERIRQRDRLVDIVFATGAATEAVRGYAVDALGYLVKPVRYPALARELDRAVERAGRRGGQPVLLDAVGGPLRLDPAQIVAFEGSRRQVLVHTLDGRHLVRGPLKALEEQVGERGFYRCHHGFLVGLRHVVTARQDSCETVTRQRIPVSRARRQGFLAALTDYLGA